MVAGASAAGFTGANLYIIGLRKKYIGQTPWKRIAEPVAYMLIVAGGTVGAAAKFPCTNIENADPAIVDKLVGLHCPPGKYNEVATLLYNAGGEVIKLLWSRHFIPPEEMNLPSNVSSLPDDAGRHTFSPEALLILLALYFPTACLLGSSIVPTGLIVPVLLIGGTIGRLVSRVPAARAHVRLHSCRAALRRVCLCLRVPQLGLLTQFILPGANHSADADCDGIPWYLKIFSENLDACNTGWNWVDPGAFAIYGSAAFFGGLNRLHLTIPVIFMEITGQACRRLRTRGPRAPMHAHTATPTWARPRQVRMLLPIMLACKVGSLTADYLHPHSLFHAISEASVAAARPAAAIPCNQ